MKNKILILAMLGVFSANFIHSDEVEEVVVQASILNVTQDKIGDPLHILSGTDISDFGTTDLGGTLDSLLGVTSSDYGTAVGQPIIRGLSGSRVKILTNGLVNRDVAGIGADHKNEVDLNDIQQIEVVRGPSSLLYANGATGGIINIVDNTIATSDIEKRLLKLGFETQSVNSGDGQSFSVADNLGGLNLYFSYSDSSFGNYDIPSGAVLHEEEEHHDDEDDHGDDDHDEHEEDKGYLDNSDSAQEATRFGVSKVADWGYVGLAVSSSESIFGVPYHGEGHEDHGDEHGDEEEGHDEHEGERIFSNTESDKVNIKGQVGKVDFFFQDSEYSHTEQHAEEEHGDEHGDEDGDDHGHGEEGPTTFSNDSSEFGFIVDLSNDLMTQKVSLNSSEETVKIFGDEAFMNPADREELTIGYFAKRDFDMFEVSFGVRYDQIDTSGSLTEHHEEDGHDEEDHDEDHEEHHGDMIRANYLQQDAEFNGYELLVGRTIALPNGSLTVSLGQDSVIGKFNADSADESYVPRLTPKRTFIDVDYSSADYSAGISFKDVKPQYKTAMEESSTEGFMLVDMNVAKEFALSSDVGMTVSFFAKNLMDERARNHTSFVKNQVPLAGRNIGFKFNITF